MTEFQRRFILTYLEKLDAVLSNPYELNDARFHYTKGSQDPRYQYNSNIKDRLQWSADEAVLFNSALYRSYEPTSRILHLCGFYQGEEFYRELAIAKELFNTQVIPKITTQVTGQSCLSSVRNNISKVKLEYFAEENRYGFFSVMAAGLVAGVALATASYFKMK